MTALELLAPARNKDIGIAAIDCGADAVYIGGPAFGARKAAGNSISDIAQLCSYAHKFGVRIFLTVNTLLQDDGELQSARSMMREAQDAGVDAFIIQDPVLMDTQGIHVPMHASTQCAIRDLQTARYYESLGAGRIVLERELSLQQVLQIAAGVSCEVECFVHGALCVCYSGDCYLSEHLTGRSANRGECAQPCRSRYDLVDAEGRVLVSDKALLSLKDLNLIERLRDLADAGVCSFKIEGRLKNSSYVRNVVRQYSLALDALVAAEPGMYRRSSFGRVSEGFSPAVDKTFNRGYTQLYIDGRRGRWSSMDAPKAMGELIGRVEAIKRGGREMTLKIDPAYEGLTLANGDGFCFVDGAGITGFRGDVCQGLSIAAKDIPSLKAGDALYRNISVAFERRMDAEPCRREIDVSVELATAPSGGLDIVARSEDGRTASIRLDGSTLQGAKDPERMLQTLASQLSKRHLHYKVTEVKWARPSETLPFLPASTINAIRRNLIEEIDRQTPVAPPLRKGRRDTGVSIERQCPITGPGSHGGGQACVSGRHGSTELMRTRYCIKYELGLCSKLQGHASTGPLYLINNGHRLRLGFDCGRCEMTVFLPRTP